MFRLALRTLRFRKGGFAASFIALFFGAAIVMACGGLMETGIRDAVPPQRLAAAPLVVATGESYVERARVDASLVAKIAAVPGVAKALPDVSFPLDPLRDRVPIGGGEVDGHAWSSAELTPYSLAAGTAPADGSVVLDDGVAAATGQGVGGTVSVAIGGRIQDFRVSGVASAASDNRAVFFSDADATQLHGKSGKVDAIGVLPAGGVSVADLQERLTAVLADPELAVLAGDDRGRAEVSGSPGGGDDLVALSAVFGGLAVMVAMFVVAGTLGLSVQQRHREMALLRAIGSTPGQLRRMILGETIVVAVLATALAFPLNLVLGRWLLDQLAGAGVTSEAIAFRQGWIPVAAGVGISLLSATAAAFVAGRGAALTRPTEALAEASLQTKWFSWIRLTFALICLGGGTALSVVTALVMSGPVAASTAGPTAMLWASGLALLSPGITRTIIAVLRWPVRAVTGLSGYLAVMNSDARRIRVAGAITPVMLATGLATALIYLQTTTAGGAPGFADDLTADAAVTSQTGGVPLAMVSTIRSQQGVGAVSALIDSSATFRAGEDDDDSATALGVTGDGVEGTLGISATSGRLADLTGNAVAVTTDRAERLHYTLGDSVRLRMGDGADVDAKLVAVYEGSGEETMLLPADLVAKHTTTGLASQILVAAADGTSASALIGTLQALAATDPDIRVGDRASLVSGGGGGGEQTGAWVNYLLVAMILAYTVISLVNTLVIATGERRREFALQRLIGATHGQILRMVGVEAVLIALGGIILGALVSAMTLIPFAYAVYDSPWPSGPLWIYLAVTGGATVLTLLSTVLSTGYVLRTPPVEAAATMS
ncbi:FtsX-like permease family protein [Umezawaea sp. Da 62-37]|uniref:FtsX-like permease family protein n=1 Tax=Umezawaea sp. Da 62-37 TaxID=3075927 RepID=UPI0028F6E440|nr:FtsX-like permease family protein [Umezawaea sp. Da 62-37]WNV84476.1 FtsX-like permease family protein [Umezawaea sp. Da 62-37]